MPVQLIAEIPDPVVRHFKVVPLKLKIKFNGQTTKRTVRIRREVHTKPLTPQVLGMKRAALKRRITCGTSKVPLASLKAKALAAAQAEICKERRARIRAEQRLFDYESDRRQAAKYRAAEHRRRLIKGAEYTHKNKLYSRYHKEDTTHYPTLYREGREPGNPFFKANYRAWRDNINAHRARMDTDCESSS